MNLPELSTISENESVTIFKILLTKTTAKIENNIIDTTQVISNTVLLLPIICVISLELF